MQDHRDRLPPAGRPPRMGRLRAAIGQDLGVDLGTANTLIFLRGRGVVLAQPSFVAIDTNEGALIAAGEDARILGDLRRDFNFHRKPRTPVLLRPWPTSAWAELVYRRITSGAR